MSHSESAPSEQTSCEGTHQGLIRLAVVATLAGLVVGLVCALFRLCLIHVDQLRNHVIERTPAAIGIPLMALAAAAACATAVYLVVRFSPYAVGSGIPHVEAVIRDDVPPAPWTLIPVKFVGGILAIGSGLALGREGPSVQIGATTALLAAQAMRVARTDQRAILAAGAGAGLTTAFNAPIAGAVFVLEELAQRFNTRLTIATLCASASAIAVARVFLGETPDFVVSGIRSIGYGVLPVSLVLGIVCGAIGAVYNRSITGTLHTFRELKFPAPWRAAAIGAAVGALAWMAPTMVGGGDLLTQQAFDVHTNSTLAAVCVSTTLVFLLRFALGPISYAAGAPGGLFAPMLVLGAQVGLMYGIALKACLPPTVAAEPHIWAIVGVAAFFAAVVRSPVTGIVLTVELTGSAALLLPMLAASGAAMAVAAATGNPPIYESLRK